MNLKDDPLEEVEVHRWGVDVEISTKKMREQGFGLPMTKDEGAKIDVTVEEATEILRRLKETS